MAGRLWNGRTQRERDVHLFTHGDCHVLARAIQWRTGWPIYCLHDGNRSPNYHAFVMMPDGRMLDVLGAKSPAAMVRWGHRLNSEVRGYVRTDWAYLKESWGAYFLSTASPKRARVVADTLLQEWAA